MEQLKNVPPPPPQLVEDSHGWTCARSTCPCCPGIIVLRGPSGEELRVSDEDLMNAGRAVRNFRRNG